MCVCVCVCVCVCTLSTVVITYMSVKQDTMLYLSQKRKLHPVEPACKVSVLSNEN